MLATATPFRKSDGASLKAVNWAGRDRMRAPPTEEAKEEMPSAERSPDTVLINRLAWQLA